MKKTGFYKQDWFLALAIGLAFAVAILGGAAPVNRLEYYLYDAGVRMTPRSAGAASHIAIVAIDDRSIERLGRWPWPRSVLARTVAWLGRAPAKAIGLLVFLSEPQVDPALAYVQRLQDYLAANPLPRDAQRQQADITGLLGSATNGLDADAALSRTLANVPDVYLPMYFRTGRPLGRPSAPLPDFVQRDRLTNVIARRDHPAYPEQAVALRYPLAAFGNNAAGVGHLNLFLDPVGGVRTETLVMDYYGDYYPSLALLLAARSLNLGPRDIAVDLGDGVRLGGLYLKTNARMQLYSGFYRAPGGASPFPTYSFYDVQAGNVPAAVFRNKIVLIGSTAVGVGSTYATPVSGSMSGPELTANVVASILNQDFYVRPDWAPWAEGGVFLLAVLYLMFVLPRLGAGVAASVSAALFLLLLAVAHFLLVDGKIWLRVAGPLLLLVTGHLLLTTKRFFTAERQKQAAETDSAQTNRLLGLTFQNQGQLDMALDKFLRLPVDESVLELIYNLALDFERKRQFNKAAAAYDYVLRHAPRFRDAAERRQRADQAGNNVLLGARARSGGTILLDGVDQKPTLGRYRVERELGKGAMGTVYLGRDPKINRPVAIKTLAFSEFDEAELPHIKERFFREAEAAGRLSHPHIVTIYDAGEEQDLAYIAMEYLAGKDLTRYLRPGRPLPVPWILDIVGQAADALAYAHAQGVVHRDVKPANVMIDEARRAVKLTDFGIAHVAASSRTKTGAILGTPSYMSPEQIAGKHVDGRSDLFSLGVMLYEMLTGAPPFRGDSLAALLHGITHEPPADPATLRPDMPASLRAVLDRILQKDPARRYQTADEVKFDLRRCRPPSTEAKRA